MSNKKAKVSCKLLTIPSSSKVSPIFSLWKIPFSAFVSGLVVFKVVGTIFHGPHKIKYNGNNFFVIPVVSQLVITAYSSCECYLFVESSLHCYLHAFLLLYTYIIYLRSLCQASDDISCLWPIRAVLLSTM